MEEAEQVQIPFVEEKHEVEEEGREEVTKEVEIGEPQTQRNENATQEKSGSKPKPRPTVVRDPGKSLLPLARVQRIMKSDKVSVAVALNMFSPEVATSCMRERGCSLDCHCHRQFFWHYLFLHLIKIYVGRVYQTNHIFCKCKCHPRKTKYYLAKGSWCASINNESMQLVLECLYSCGC
jgi:hypothetical protein